MALEITAIDAVVGGIATAFFGGLLAAGAYRLKQQVELREQVLTMTARLEALRGMDEVLKTIADGKAGRLGESIKARGSKQV